MRTKAVTQGSTRVQAVSPQPCVRAGALQVLQMLSYAEDMFWNKGPEVFHDPQWTSLHPGTWSSNNRARLGNTCREELTWLQPCSLSPYHLWSMVSLRFSFSV